ncbi:cupin-like domain-containing protein [Erythrobacter litoralis]|uniref:cupin-like domain-containing protein n=1 Tax=Erythrobacter litoralis TaxID=39960 RepID=UPI002435B290|nr:cupin-like domain-containing protein [Erythrobacter litoralis]MDG6079269.1 cupin-like domain-containing protein [Erythrobacter litoralis]
MSPLPIPAPVREMEGPVSAEILADIRERRQPVVMRGLVADWPAVAAARQGDEALCAAIAQGGSTRPVQAIAAKPEEGGRFFYTPGLTDLNFIRGKGRLETFLGDLLRLAGRDAVPAMAVQSEDIGEVIPAFAHANTLGLLPGVRPRIWIGNRIRVAPHFDVKENIACCIGGRRIFTIFPPDQTANLYPGPFELTPAGTPISLVDLSAPDLDAFPRFADAQAAAQEATLAPGDAIYIPYCWWHGVASLDDMNVLVNYWWNDGEPKGIGGGYEAMLHALYAYRHLPPEQRDVWRDLLDYYVFERSGDPAAHLPDDAKGVLGPPSPGLFARMRGTIRDALAR